MNPYKNTVKIMYVQETQSRSMAWLQNQVLLKMPVLYESRLNMSLNDLSQE